MSEPSPLAEYFAMGGYAVYIWPAYAIALATISGMAVQTHLQWRRWKERVRTLENASEESAQNCCEN